jgi:3-oxoacyl-[acyl-carrier protein] reductase
MPDGSVGPGFGLSGRVVLVTGGSRGIGAAVAELAAHAGASTAIGYRASAEAANAVVERIVGRGGTAAAFRAELTDAGEVAGLVSSVERELGPVDGLVNSAGVVSNGDFLETGLDEWEHVVRNDLYSVVLACREVLPGMVERGRGAIVNLTSRLALVGAADAAPYASAKAAVTALTKSLALAYGPHGVRVNAVSPGTTNTDMGRAIIESPQGRERAARIPIRRFVEPGEVAAAAVFLLTDAASGLTGQTLDVNGGELMP